MPLNKLFYKSVNEYTLYTVNAESIRNSNLLYEDFTNFATWLDFESLVPHDEIWFDEANEEDENKFFIENALKQLYLVSIGYTKKEAYDRAVQFEKSLREKFDNVRFNPEKVNKKTKREIYKEKIGELNGITIFVVDGHLVRDIYDTDFVEGGHGYVYSWIPNDEIWIDNDLKQDEIKFVLIHEYIELIYMRDYGIEYNKAHELASEYEFKTRSNNLQPLQKVYVKEHFRTDPITGKQVYVHGYDDKRILHPDIPGGSTEGTKEENKQSTSKEGNKTTLNSIKAEQSYEDPEFTGFIEDKYKFPVEVDNLITDYFDKFGYGGYGKRGESIIEYSEDGYIKGYIKDVGDYTDNNVETPIFDTKLQKDIIEHFNFQNTSSIWHDSYDKARLTIFKGNELMKADNYFQANWLGRSHNDVSTMNRIAVGCYKNGFAKFMGDYRVDHSRREVKNILNNKYFRIACLASIELVKRRFKFMEGELKKRDLYKPTTLHRWVLFEPNSKENRELIDAMENSREVTMDSNSLESWTEYTPEEAERKFEWMLNNKQYNRICIQSEIDPSDIYYHYKVDPSVDSHADFKEIVTSANDTATRKVKVLGYYMAGRDKFIEAKGVKQ
jgi:hypothetical protein